MTQQTLSDALYVTRQAVSRWECGARYPDLLTAKKLSEVLEVSLDELLSGEEMKKCVEKNPIVESPVIGRVCLICPCRGSIFTYEHFYN